MASKTARPTQVFPEGYDLKGTLDLSKNMRLAIIVNIAGTVLLVFFGWLFFSLLRFIRPHYPGALNLLVITLENVIKVIGILLAVTVVMVVLHEGLHGLVFWLMTHRRPTFGFRGSYAFAAAPDWYFPRNPYLLVCLAPFVLITVVGLGLMAVVPDGLIPSLLLLISMNAAGAVGDLMVAAWLLVKPASFMVRDFGDGVNLYGPGEFRV